MSGRRLLIISGLSGAGKTIALHALEDAGYYGVDNLPIGILSSFVAYMAEQDLPHFHNVAVGIDEQLRTDTLGGPEQNTVGAQVHGMAVPRQDPGQAV